MAWVPPVSPIAGTTILVAYATANIVNPALWLRAMTGGADPPAAGYMVTSDSGTATSWKTGQAAIGAVLGYAPINKSGDTGIGNLTSVGTVTAVGFAAGAGSITNAGTYVSTGTGGAVIGSDGITNSGPYQGGSTAAGTLGVKGLFVGVDGINSAGPLSIGGSTLVGVPLGAIVAFATDAALTAAGASWTRHTALDGRLPIGAGTTFSQTFAEATNYGANWTPSSALSISNIAVLADSQTVLVNNGTATSVATATHTHPAPTLSGGSTAWLPAMRAVIWGRRI